MRITDWNVIGSTGSGQATDTIRNRTDRIQINTDGPVLDRITLEAYTKFPAFFQFHPQDSSLIFLNYDWNPTVGSIHEVLLHYSNQYPESKNPYGFIENPLLRPAMISRNSFSIQEKFDVDATGNRVETTAGEPLVTMQEYKYANFHVVKNVDRPFTIGLAALKQQFKAKRLTSLAYRGKSYPKAYDSIDFINQDAVVIKGVIYPPYTLWATNFAESDYKIEGKIIYYELSFDIRHKPSGWYRKILNAGYLYNKHNEDPSYQGTSSEWKPTRIKVGDPPGYPRNPVPIDENGEVFKNDEGEVITSETGGLNPGQLIYLWFLPFQTLNFKANLPRLSGTYVPKLGVVQ